MAKDQRGRKHPPSVTEHVAVGDPNDCPGQKTPKTLKAPARPYKNDIQGSFTVENAKET
jgi:hypothetical protein